MRQSCYNVAGLDDAVVIRNIDGLTDYDYSPVIVGVDVVIHMRPVHIVQKMK